METLDKLLVSCVDNEKALGDFKEELASILSISVQNIEVNVGTLTNHSIISQMLVVTIRSKYHFTKKELEQIPYDSFDISNVPKFMFKVGETSI